MKNKFLNNIENSFLDSIQEGDQEYIDHLLEAEGYNIHNVNDLAEKNIKKIMFMSKAKANKIKDDRLIQAALRLKDGINKGLDKPISVIKSLIETRSLSFQFRNLDQLTESEIKEIIKGHNLLSIIEDLDNEERS